MCGILGIRIGRGCYDRSALERALAGLAHRGPDGSGIQMLWDASLCVALGHRRLAIIDLTDAGRQPMEDPVAGNWVTFNGEIYNFVELRKQLEAVGHVFLSNSDTEVILKAYAEWGIGCWRRLRGIFAFGLWDPRMRQLHLVRDHLGVKPLYFARKGTALVFASEVRTLLASGLVERKLSHEGLESYLKYGSVQEPSTLIDGVESLSPGSCLTSEADGSISVRHFWRVTECVERNWVRPPSTADVRNVLEDSISRQMVADVPVGIFLSGGLDSTAIAALAMRTQRSAIRTFCVGSEEGAHDESVQAARTAQLLGSDHTTLVLQGSLVRQKLEAALSSYDQPSYDGINSYFVSCLVREAGIKVALSGLGGDELFVGYNGFRKSLALEDAGRWVNRLPRGLKKTLARAVAAASPVGNSQASALSELLSPTLAHPYFASRVLFCQEHAARLIGRTAITGRTSAWELREAQLARDAATLAPVDRVSFLEMQTYMLSTLLRDSDQMSMAHGLELRVPFVDHMVLESVLPIPAADKVREGVNKRVLIEALKGIIPEEVIGRKKRGFTLPFQSWLTRDLREEVAACFHSSDPRGPWDVKIFRGVWRDFENGRVAWSRVLTLFVLEHWLKQNGVSV